MINNKTIIVTGGSGGIGSAVARSLAKKGARIVLIGRNYDHLLTTRNSLDGLGHEAISFDLSNTAGIEDIISQIAISGPIYGLVHAAGGGTITPLKSLSTTVLNSHMQVNLYAFIELVRQISKRKNLDPDGGSIIGISSFAAENGEQGQTAYAAAKAAMDAAVHTLSFELTPKSVRINTIRPGMVRSEATEKYIRDMGQERFDFLISKQLLGIGEPETIAEFCAFMIDEGSRFMTGRSIYVDGGRFL